MLLTKSLLDLISATMLAASLGVGVLLSAAFVLVFQAVWCCWPRCWPPSSPPPPSRS